jgi:RNA polymerase II subunit A-like phosphatase
MLIKTPHSLHYPLTITELLKERNDKVEKFEPLFSYAYKSTVTEGNEYGEEFTVEKTFPARFESETDGVVASWKVVKGAVIAGPG